MPVYKIGCHYNVLHTVVLIQDLIQVTISLHLCSPRRWELVSELGQN